MTSPGTTPLAKVIEGNVRAQRARLGLKQSQVAERMRVFGFKWHYQTVSYVEHGTKMLTAEELVWLAICLETTPAVLMQPVTADVASPSGVTVAAQRLAVNDASVTWDGSELEVTASVLSAVDARRGEHEDLAARLGEYRNDLRRRAGRQDKTGETRTYDSTDDTGVMDIKPRRPRKGEDQQ
jgi:transcriptional regulator with XRE-family HTH domain